MHHLSVCNLAFPDDEDLPSRLTQLAQVEPVPLHRLRKLGEPKIGPRLRHGRLGAATMPVPEAAVNQYDAATAAHHDIGPSRKPAPVQPIADTETA